MVFGLKVRRGSLWPVLPLARTRRKEEPRSDEGDFTPINAAAPSSAVSSTSCASLPRQFRCPGCESVILFPANIETRTCSHCGAVTALSDVIDQEERRENARHEISPSLFTMEEAPPLLEDPEVTPQSSSEAAYKKSHGGRRRREPRKGQDDVDYIEVMAMLMQLAVTVCNADLLDCVAVVRSFVFSEHAALRSVATKVCHELALLDGGGVSGDDDHVNKRGSLDSTRSSSLKPAKRVEHIVSAFLTERLGTDKRGSNLGVSRRNSDDVPPADLDFEQSNADPTNGPSFKRSGTSNTEISVTSFTDFAKENKRFALHPDAQATADEDKAGTLYQVGSRRMSAAARRSSCTSGKPAGFGKMGSMESMASGHTSMSRRSQVSSMIRSMLRGQADKSKSVNIGDLTWGMDGVPQDESGQIAQQSKALIQRYGGERRQHRVTSGGSLSPEAAVQGLPANRGSLMVFLLRGAYMSGMEEVSHSTGEESMTTTALLDQAMAGMDACGAPPRLKRTQTNESMPKGLRRGMSKDSGASSLFSGPPAQNWLRRATTVESGCSFGSPVIVEDPDVAESDVSDVPKSKAESSNATEGRSWQRSHPSGMRSGRRISEHAPPLGLIEEASAASSCRTSKAGEWKGEEAEETPMTAKEKWLKRKEDKKKKRQESSRTTYGAIIRNGYEQHLPELAGGGAEDPPAPGPEAGAGASGGSGGASSAHGTVPSSAGEQPPAETQPIADTSIDLDAISKEEARAKWEKRRAEKRAARKLSSKTTYGQLVRLEHEQMIPLDGAQDEEPKSSSSSSSAQLSKTQALPSLRFKTHDGSLTSSPASSTTVDALPARRPCNQSSDSLMSSLDTGASVMTNESKIGKPWSSVDSRFPKRATPGDTSTSSQECHGILKEKTMHVEESRRRRPPARSVEFNLKRNLVYDV